MCGPKICHAHCPSSSGGGWLALLVSVALSAATVAGAVWLLVQVGPLIGLVAGVVMAGGMTYALHDVALHAGEKPRGPEVRQYRRELKREHRRAIAARRLELTAAIPMPAVSGSTVQQVQQ